MLKTVNQICGCVWKVDFTGKLIRPVEACLDPKHQREQDERLDEIGDEEPTEDSSKPVYESEVSEHPKGDSK